MDELVQKKSASYKDAYKVKQGAPCKHSSRLEGALQSNPAESHQRDVRNDIGPLRTENFGPPL